jgi:hypothetical protein
VQSSLPDGAAAAGKLTSCQEQGMVQQDSCLRQACCQKQRKMEGRRRGFQDQDMVQKGSCLSLLGAQDEGVVQEGTRLS